MSSKHSLKNQNFLVAIENKAADVCNADQFAHNPCRCCKMDCWYSIAKGATHELGHMPGQAGEQVNIFLFFRRFKKIFRKH